jgi:hypothetical protein
MSYRQEDAAREILSLHPCPARCGARHRRGLCGFGRCRARSPWRVLFTASRAGLSSPPATLGRIRGRFPRWPPRGRRARLQSPFGLLPTRPPAAPSVAQPPRNPNPSRPWTIPPRSHPRPLAASYRRFLTTIDSRSSSAPDVPGSGSSAGRFPGKRLEGRAEVDQIIHQTSHFLPVMLDQPASSARLAIRAATT